MICNRCQGRKTVINFGYGSERISVQCPVCLGLGTYEEDKNWEPQRPSETTIAIHSTTLTLEDILDLLPERHVTHDKENE